MWRVSSLHNTLILRPTLLKPSTVVNQECLQQRLKWPVLCFFPNQILLSAAVVFYVLVKVGFSSSFGSSFDCQPNEKLHLTHLPYKLFSFPFGHSLVCNKNSCILKHFKMCLKICFQCFFKRSGQNWVIFQPSPVPELFHRMGLGFSLSGLCRLAGAFDFQTPS